MGTLTLIVQINGIEIEEEDKSSLTEEEFADAVVTLIKDEYKDLSVTANIKDYRS